ncbi:MAG: DNA primase, partial [Planctomycetaceae bacterium]
MTTNDLGFRIVGPCTNERRLVDWQAAFVGYAALDERAEVNREAYLSAFTFGDDFRRHLDATDSTKGFDGVCGAEFVWFDIDREGDLETARRDAARLCLRLIERYSLDDDGPLIFFSGSKGFHVGLPTDLWQPSASLTFHRTARRLAEGLAAAVQVTIDGGVYDKVRAFRAPNSRHPKTGLHKRA